MVTDKKFTQGDWKVVKDETYPTLHQIWNNVDFGEMPTYIARTCYATLSEANAKLIAAAPEMYSALESSLQMLEQTLKYRNANGIRMGNVFLEATISQVKEAIKKATE